MANEEVVGVLLQLVHHALELGRYWRWRDALDRTLRASTGEQSALLSTRLVAAPNNFHMPAAQSPVTAMRSLSGVTSAAPPSSWQPFAGAAPPAGGALDRPFPRLGIASAALLDAVLLVTHHLFLVSPSLRKVSARGHFRCARAQPLCARAAVLYEDTPGEVRDAAIVCSACG